MLVYKPDINEFQLTLFGNSFGESILLHLSNGKWIIIDSCINPNNKKNAPLEYLETIGVDIEKQVIMLVVSHWDSDHIEGASTILEKCKNAKLVLSSAINCKEFCQFANIVNERPVYSSLSRGTDEILKIMSIGLDKKKRGEPYNFIWAKSNTPLYSDKNEGFGYSGKITSLSPSDHAITSAMIEIAKLIPREGSKIGHKSSIIPNLFSIVLWVSVEDKNILLGADLENRAHPDGAWAIIANDNFRPEGSADVFKIPHHGSENAYCHDVYENMLIKKHISILTPFKNGNIILPKDKDIARLKESGCSEVFMACQIPKKKYKHDSSVERTFKERTKKRETLNTFGFITVSKNLMDVNSQWKTSTFGQAYKL